MQTENKHHNVFIFLLYSSILNKVRLINNTKRMNHFFQSKYDVLYYRSQ